LRYAESGGGAFADLGSHLVDMAAYILGDVKTVRAEMHTYIRERPAGKGIDRKETVDVDDWMLCTLELASGVNGVIEVTRMAAGAHEDAGFEIYGSKGSLVYTEREHAAVRLFSLRSGEWISGPADVPNVEGERPIDQIWPGAKLAQGMMTNAHMAAEYDLLLNIIENKRSLNDFRSASKVQQVIESAYLSAGRGGEPQKLL
jgi:predicted dehydrogenase